MFSFRSLFKSIISHTPKFVLQERLSLAVERAEEAERQVAKLQTETGRLSAQLERASLDYEDAKKELEAFKALGAEKIKFALDVEFRCGPKTGGLWKAFCPRCHLPLALPDDEPEYAGCSDRNCNWLSSMRPANIRQQTDSMNFGFGGGA